jgi:murein DD-endopeptidase MepM/ murein hydrolase activator NlpD
MENLPLQEFPPEDEGAQGEQARQRPDQISKWMDALAHLGLGESFLRIGTNVLAFLLVIGVAWLMQTLYHQTGLGWTPGDPAASAPTPNPILSPEQIPIGMALDPEGIPRQAKLHTNIPTRPRLDVIEYTVQQGDTVFGIADKFALKPSTILFGNYDTLKDTPHSLRPGQELNILPTDGTYYEWQGTESLTKVAEFFGVDADTIVNYPGNHLDPDAVGDLSAPAIAAGTWLIVPGGQRDFNSWSAPIGVTRTNPASARVIGPGACGVINGGNIGFGTFIWPSPKHWLSGTPYAPDIGHPAIDLAAQLDDAAYATDAGVVVYAGWNDWGYGNLVILDHGNGWQSLYAHLDVIYVGCGQSVGQGDIIALIGSTGNSTGPHLHFELMNSQYGKVNPLNFLPAP